MAGRLILAGALALSALVVAGTWAYVAGYAPPFPARMWAFNGLTLLCVAYAFAFGRR